MSEEIPSLIAPAYNNNTTMLSDDADSEERKDPELTPAVNLELTSLTIKIQELKELLDKNAMASSEKINSLEQTIKQTSAELELLNAAFIDMSALTRNVLYSLDGRLKTQVNFTFSRKFSFIEVGCIAGISLCIGALICKI